MDDCLTRARRYHYARRPYRTRSDPTPQTETHTHIAGGNPTPPTRVTSNVSPEARFHVVLDGNRRAKVYR